MLFKVFFSEKNFATTTHLSELKILSLWASSVFPSTYSSGCPICPCPCHFMPWCHAILLRLCPKPTKASWSVVEKREFFVEFCCNLYSPPSPMQPSGLCQSAWKKSWNRFLIWLAANLILSWGSYRGAEDEVWPHHQLCIVLCQSATNTLALPESWIVLVSPELQRESLLVFPTDSLSHRQALS